MIPSNRETLKALCKSVVTKLENHKAITFPPRLRQIVADEVYALIGPYVWTDQDVRDKALQKIGTSRESLDENELNENTAFVTAKKLILEQFGQSALASFYFQKPVREVVLMIVGYLMRSASIDEVYETDEDLEKMILEWIRSFNPKNVH